MKKLLLIYFLLAILVQIRPIKFLLSRAFLSTVYVPILSTYSRVKSMQEAEKRVIELEKKLARIQVREGRVDSVSNRDSVEVVTLVGYEPFGFPGILTYYPPLGKRGDLLLWKGVVAGKVISIEQGAGEAATVYGNIFRLGVVVGEYNGILEGGTPPVVKYIPVEYSVRKGDTVYTSGIGENRIRGIPVGVVTKVEKDRLAPYFHRIEVKPFFDVHRAYKLILLAND